MTGADRPAWRIDANGQLHFRGGLKTTATFAYPHTMLTGIPAGSRPSGDRKRLLYTDGGTPAQVKVTQAGTIICIAAGDQTEIDLAGLGPIIADR